VLHFMSPQCCGMVEKTLRRKEKLRNRSTVTHSQQEKQVLSGQITNLVMLLRMGAFKLIKCTFPGSKQLKSIFILCFFKFITNSLTIFVN